MRRLLRILLNTATVLSLVLCAATMAAWVRSYQAQDAVWWGDHQRMLLGTTFRGGSFIEFTLRRSRDSMLPAGAGWVEYAPQSYAEAGYSEGKFVNRFYFNWLYAQDSSTVMGYTACPYWFIMLLTAILPAARLAGWRRRARRLRLRPGLCQHCGYDCRATPQGGRCPECGHATANEASR